MSRIVIMRLLALVSLVVGVAIFVWEEDVFFLIVGALVAFVLWPFGGEHSGSRGESAAAYDWDSDDGGSDGDGGDGGGGNGSGSGD